MKKTNNIQLARLSVIIYFFLTIVGGQLGFGQNLSARTFEQTAWKVGVARSVITPETAMRLGGYAIRTAPSDGKLHDLFVKALFLEDKNGERAIFISMDLIGISRQTSGNICHRLMEEYGLDRSQVVLSCSHTHSGPVINHNHFNMYPSMDTRQKEAIVNYEEFVKEQVFLCVGQAIKDLSPAVIKSGKGMARFAVNRRFNDEASFPFVSEIKGPSDYSVPVLAAYNQDESVKAVVFGYACHANTLDGTSWSGDYPGFAQIEIEEAYKGVTAFYFSGCGADQKPVPRKTIPLAKQYGSELSAAVIRCLSEPMMVLDPQLKTRYKEVVLKLDDPVSLNKLKAISESGSWKQAWAKYWIEQMKNGASIPDSYPFYPVQTWQLGSLSVVVLGGEVVVDYAINLRKDWGENLFVMAYSNDVMAYIPTEEILKKGGYEASSSMSAYGLPAMWAPGIEKKIRHEIDDQLLLMGNKRVED